MTKTVLITGSTDGIGLLAAQKLAQAGHTVLLHGRNTQKLEKAAAEVGGNTESYVADLSNGEDVRALASAIKERHARLDIVINNAGVLKASNPILDNGLDVRFMVNTVAPFALTQSLLPLMPKDGRIVNVSSAAQAPIDPAVMLGKVRVDDLSTYSQSKLAITIWTRELAKEVPDGPLFIAVNPGSLLASKMVKEGFGIAGNDLNIGADILCDAALGERFAKSSGHYFDNDNNRFSDPHAAALDERHAAEVMALVRQSAEQSV